tara:strand:- start:19 stop:273 length:255 start_codon:yes stop_codon:yes gene_type:complete
MYGRTIMFTLLAPSLWSVLENVATKVDKKDYSRYLFKSTDNTGFITEIFPNQDVAGSNLETLRAVQGLKEQAMAKVTIIEGTKK